MTKNIGGEGVAENGVVEPVETTPVGARGRRPSYILIFIINRFTIHLYDYLKRTCGKV